MVKATEFRKHMFEILELAVNGEPVEIMYKGSKLTLSAPPTGSKLAGAVRRNALKVDPQSIVESDAGLMGEFEKAWVAGDQEF